MKFPQRASRLICKMHSLVVEQDAPIAVKLADRLSGRRSASVLPAVAFRGNISFNALLGRIGDNTEEFMHDGAECLALSFSV